MMMMTEDDTTLFVMRKSNIGSRAMIRRIIPRARNMYPSIFMLFKII